MLSQKYWKHFLWILSSFGWCQSFRDIINVSFKIKKDEPRMFDPKITGKTNRSDKNNTLYMNHEEWKLVESKFGSVRFEQFRIELRKLSKFEPNIESNFEKFRIEYRTSNRSSKSFESNIEDRIEVWKISKFESNIEPNFEKFRTFTNPGR